MNKSPNRKRLVPLARILRQASTPWERKLWSYLRAGKIDGLKFKRQVSLDNYIVDFYCPEKKLVIELDGGQHNLENEKIFDAKRTQKLEENGCKVLRFWNNDIQQNIEGVIEHIEKSLLN